jgi:hypothetical protein
VPLYLNSNRRQIQLFFPKDSSPGGTFLIARFTIFLYASPFGRSKLVLGIPGGRYELKKQSLYDTGCLLFLCF